MQRVVLLFAVVANLAGGCLSEPEPECFEFCDEGRIKGVFHLGERELSDSEWIEMIQLSGPPDHRCGPGDCGMIYAGIRGGGYWAPGRWRVIPPRVQGWIPPDPVVVVIREDELTTFEAVYRRA